MKTYELIQDYPGSPKLGSISNKLGQLQVLKKGKLVIDGSKRLKQSEIQYLKDKRYWKEVVEKDYEILQMKNSHGNFYSLFENEELGRYETENHTIHSVKRLSDGEVFTVGGIVNSYIIDIICLSEEGIKIFFQDERLKPYLLKDIILRKPLFTTEDGVDIFEGDKYYYPTHLYTISSEILPIENKISAESWDNLMRYSQNNNPKFSTKEAAEEYVLMNKPCLSINDVLSSYDILGKECRKLKKIVKSKL